MTNQITTNPCKPKTKINTAFSLDLAGWIMARYKNQRLVKVDLWEQEGRIGFACDFETAPEEKMRLPGIHEAAERTAGGA